MHENQFMSWTSFVALSLSAGSLWQGFLWQGFVAVASPPTKTNSHVVAYTGKIQLKPLYVYTLVNVNPNISCK
jgi:hypothetical protein